MDELLGVFQADQQRERRLRRDNYSHLVLVFDTGIIVNEASPIRDEIAAVLHRLPLPLPHHLHQAWRLFRLGPKYGTVESRISEIGAITPDELAKAFPEHVRGLDDEQIKSSVLRRVPPELRIKYRSDHVGEQQIWLKLPIFGDVDEVERIMSALLGDRLKKAGIAEGHLDAALALLPG